MILKYFLPNQMKRKINHFKESELKDNDDVDDKGKLLITVDEPIQGEPKEQRTPSITR
jgi:hypothetical protein